MIANYIVHCEQLLRLTTRSTVLDFNISNTHVGMLRDCSATFPALFICLFVVRVPCIIVGAFYF